MDQSTTTVHAKTPVELTDEFWEAFAELDQPGADGFVAELISPPGLRPWLIAIRPL